ncbi:hypothetical protein K1T71_004427 [Dendrolimus kikuchii]|uniref:Uncharacterized protein n=1 Tax=Dendrolimus kikuchii TaxID=765133 RepID=A0ACC1D844_9NEOP|nr:hypothetical protein K1T71_004427 [Dendrolimus kikuchii]
MKFLFCLVLTLFLINSVTSLYCYWNTGCPYKYFSSKTPYNAIRGDIRDSVVKLTDCKPVSIWALVRHGKRNPGGANADSMKEAIKIRDYVVSSYVNGNSSLCAQDIENLRDMTVDYKMFEQPHQLSAEGHQEMLGIGKRLRQAFPNLLAELDQQNYIFRPAFGNWMENSGKSFIKGLGNNNLVLEKAKPDYDIMAPYATCGKYQRDVKTNPEIFEEARKYQESSEYLAAKDRIQRRLGIDNDLTNDNITALYDLCRFSWSGFSNNISPWCALFTTGDLQVMEYIGDIKHYYKNGYGTPMNELLGQIPMADLLTKFQEAKDGNGKKIVTYFTHATMLDMVYTALKLFKDDKPLVGSPRNQDRKWRSSKFSTFAANLIVALNRCNNNGNEEYNVVFYLNEEPLIPICKEGVCTWQEFEDKLKPFLNTNTEFCEFKSVPYK